MKQEPHCVSSLMEYKMSLTLKEMPVILNSSRISLLKVWPRNTLCNIVFREEKNSCLPERSSQWSPDQTPQGDSAQPFLVWGAGWWDKF